MSPLERLGFAVALSRWLGVRLGLGGVLSLLIDAAPAAVSHEMLIARGGVARPRITHGSLSAQVCHLREALADVGFADVIETEWGYGFRFVGDVAAIRSAAERFA